MPVTTTASSFQNLYDAFSKEYSNVFSASALLWWWLESLNMFGVRVECPSLGKEFSNGMAIGRDPEGFLFLNDPADLSNPDGGDLNVKFDVYYNTDKNAPAFVIQWYNVGATNSQCFAKFLAKDPNRVADRIIDNSPGVWTDAATSESFARLNKTSSTVNTWTLKIGSIYKQVVFPTNGHITSAPTPGKRVDTMGILIWKDINKIANGIFVDYRDDRIVFTDTNEWSKDFCAFFLPVESSINEDPLGSYVIRAGAAQWSAL